ncbi:MAG: hypothetical protein AAF456_15370 [Planctomycetota bacterium]
MFSSTRSTVFAIFFAAICAFTVSTAQAQNVNHHDRVEAYTTDVYNINFVAGVPSGLTVDGDGDTDLDLFIYDPYGNLVAWDDDYTDYCICNFVPQYNGTYTVKIKNLGSVWNAYHMWSH